jgi:hypothetical protein
VWVHTTDGFYSATKRPDRTHGHRRLGLQVRARVRDDLVTLRAEMVKAGVAKRNVSDIIETPEGDYRYRVLTTPDAWGKYLAHATYGIDYSNFKDRIHDRLGHDRAHVLMEVWTALGRLQPGGPYGMRGARTLDDLYDWDPDLDDEPYTGRDQSLDDAMAVDDMLLELGSTFAQRTSLPDIDPDWDAANRMPPR